MNKKIKKSEWVLLFAIFQLLYLTALLGILPLIILNIVLILIVIFNFAEIEGAFPHIYITLLLLSFILPLGIAEAFGWTDALALSKMFFIRNIIYGPAMMFLLSYFGMKYLGKRLLSDKINKSK